MKAFSQIRNAIELIKGYKGVEPLSLYLKNEFKKRPQFGSNDRRLMRELCICYFKVGLSLPKEQYQERILAGYFLNNTESHPVFEFLAEELKRPEMTPLINQEWEVKKSAIEKMLVLEKIFPFHEDIETQLSNTNFYKNFYNKPMTWLRVRVKAKDRFEDFLKSSKINYLIHPECPVAYGFADQINVSSWLPQIQKAVEVQDLSSLLSIYGTTFEEKEKVWDCCAGSGGKSLLLYAVSSKIELYVSDVRQTIIKNLHERFSEAGIGNCLRAVADLSKPNTEIIFENNKERKIGKANYFDTILVDAPCSGSGTWRRNPERLLFINNDELEKYISLQKAIVKNACHFLKPGGRLIYLTCSIFKKEDSAATAYFTEHLNLALEKTNIINKMSDGGDVIYRSIFKKTK